MNIPLPRPRPLAAILSALLAAGLLSACNKPTEPTAAGPAATAPSDTTAPATTPPADTTPPGELPPPADTAPNDMPPANPQPNDPTAPPPADSQTPPKQ